MKPSPCLNPFQIRDTNGVLRMVPCGRCAACLVNKGRARSFRLEQDLSSYPHRFFVTLTYKNDFLPLATFDEESNTLFHSHDCDYNGELYHRTVDDLNDFDKAFIEKQFKEFGGLPVLSHRDLINFRKRFRYYFKKLYPDAELYIYGCGEYGPSTYRPHYHLIFGTRTLCPTSVFKDCVSAAWSHCDKNRPFSVREAIGRIDVQRIVSGSCADYTAQYLNCTTHLPKVLSYRCQWRPFSSKSNRCAELLARIGQDEVRKVFDKPTLYVTQVHRGKSTSYPVPDCYLNRYFPKLPKFTHFARYELELLYSLFKYYDRPCLEDYEKRVGRVVSWTPLLDRNRVFNGDVSSLLPDTALTQLIRYVCYYDGHGKPVEDRFIQERNFKRLWYVSRRVCINADLVGVPLKQYVDKIIKYYYAYEQDKLKRFYDLQSHLLDDVVSPAPLEDIITLYYNTDSDKCDYGYYLKQFQVHSKRLDVAYIPEQSKYSFLCHGILQDTTKTKNRNDYFVAHGLRKKPFLLHLNHRLKSFILK